MRCIRVKTHIYWLTSTHYTWPRICLSHFFHFNSKHSIFFSICLLAAVISLHSNCLISNRFSWASRKSRRLRNQTLSRHDQITITNFNGLTITQPFKVAQPLSLVITIKQKHKFQSQLLLIFRKSQTNISGVKIVINRFFYTQIFCNVKRIFFFWFLLNSSGRWILTVWQTCKFVQLLRRTTDYWLKRFTYARWFHMSLHNIEWVEFNMHECFVLSVFFLGVRRLSVVHRFYERKCSYYRQPESLLYYTSPTTTFIWRYFKCSFMAYYT